MNARRRFQRGQSVVEMAIAAPVLLVLLLGGFETTVLASDKVIMGQASRQGARLAAELGGSQTNPPPATTTSIDADIVKNVLAVAGGANYTSLVEIDIYAPQAASGVFNSATDSYDKFDGNGNLQYQGFPLTSRNQTPPSETSIGVRVVWTYQPPLGMGFSNPMTLNDYTVMKASPVLF